MISANLIKQWNKNAPWKSLDQIEHDLILSKALIKLYNNPLLPKKLAFKGGTALNKLYFNPPARFSEDIDLVQIKSEPIGETITAIRDVLDDWLED